MSGYKKMADGTKLSYQELLLMEDSELEAMLQPRAANPPADPRKAELDALMPEIISRLSKRYATVELVHQDYYLKLHPDGYGYTQFNRHVKTWREAHDLSYHVENLCNYGPIFPPSRGNYSAIIPFCSLVSILTSQTDYNPV